MGQDNGHNTDSENKEDSSSSDQVSVDIDKNLVWGKRRGKKLELFLITVCFVVLSKGT